MRKLLKQFVNKHGLIEVWQVQGGYILEGWIEQYHATIFEYSQDMDTLINHAVDYAMKYGLFR